LAGEDLGLFGRQLNIASGGLGLFRSAVSDAAQSAVGIAGNLLSGSMALTDYSDALVTNTKLFGVLGETIKGLTKFAEASLEEYQSLTGIGATFGKEMVEIKMTAAELGMTVEDMTKMFQNNMSSLSNFGGTTDAAVQSFRAFSKSVLDSDLGTNMRRMGYTVSDINELLLAQGELIQADPMGRAAGRNQDVSAEAAMRLATEMDRLSKLTGKQRSEIQDQMLADRRRGDLQFYLQGKSAEEQEAFNNTLANIRTTMGDDAADAFIDMAIRGAPVTEATQQAFLAMGSEGQAAMQNLIGQLESGASFDEVSGTLSGFQGSVVDYMNSQEAANIGMLGGMNATSSAFGSMKEQMYDFENRINAGAQAGETATQTINRLNGEIAAQQETQLESAENNIIDSTIAMQEQIRETVMEVQRQALERLEDMGVQAINTVRDTIGDNIEQISGFVNNAIDGLLTVGESAVNNGAQGAIQELMNQLMGGGAGALSDEEVAAELGGISEAVNGVSPPIVEAVNGANDDRAADEIVTQEQVDTANQSLSEAVTQRQEAEAALTELTNRQTELVEAGQFERASDLQAEINVAEAEATRAAEAAEATRRVAESLSHMQRTGNVRGFASGGRLGAGELGMVGEMGPEFVTGPMNVLDTISSRNVMGLIQATQSIGSNFARQAQDSTAMQQNMISTSGDMRDVVSSLQNSFGNMNGLLSRLVDIQVGAADSQRRTMKATRGLGGNLLKGVNA